MKVKLVRESLSENTTDYVIGPEGTKRYYDENGEFHREDGPALEWPNGIKVWYKHGKVHREDGPAKDYGDGIHYYYFLNDRQYWKKDYDKIIAARQNKPNTK